jgi:hypothetical protein
VIDFFACAVYTESVIQYEKAQKGKKVRMSVKERKQQVKSFRGKSTKAGPELCIVEVWRFPR